MLNASIADEYRSQATYARVLRDFPDQKPFSNIVEAEAQHILAVSNLFRNRGLAVPDDNTAAGDVLTFGTVKAACDAAVIAETVTYKMYDGFLITLGGVPADVVSVFTNVRDAARDKHLPAFVACAK
jgi:hypothetical protein